LVKRPWIGGRPPVPPCMRQRPFAIGKSLHKCDCATSSGYDQAYQNKSAINLRCSARWREISRRASRYPPLNPRLAEAAFPSSVRGPVDFAHGCH
jgi:hypothetical protein